MTDDRLSGDDSTTPQVETAQSQTTKVTARTGFSYLLRQVSRDRTARLGLYIILSMTTIALFASVDYYLFDYGITDTLFHHPERDPDNVERLLPPPTFENDYGQGTWDHLLGTDHRGRDILARVIHGSRIAFTVGFISTGIGLVGGTIIGATSGYYGGRVDEIIQRAVETLYAIPFLVLVIAFMTAFGRNLTFAMIGVGVTSIPVFTRLIRSRVVSIREENYIEAAQAAGVKDRHIILRHVVPNSFAPVLVQATLQIGINILIVAGLSFIGYGAQPPTPSWGQMLAQSRNYLLADPWFSVWPGLAILITVFGFNLLGDGLQDAFDPRINN